MCPRSASPCRHIRCDPAGRSNGVSRCVRSGRFCWLRRAWRAGNTQRWGTPAATRSLRGSHTARRTHTVCTSGWVRAQSRLVQVRLQESPCFYCETITAIQTIDHLWLRPPHSAKFTPPTNVLNTGIGRGKVKIDALLGPSVKKPCLLIFVFEL